MKRIIFIPKTWSKIIKQRDRDNFVKRSFRKDFRIIFLREKIEFKKELSKKIGARQRCSWAWEMGHGARPEWEGEMRRGKKSRLAIESWAQRAKGI
jgi:hypothetical protein